MGQSLKLIIIEDSENDALLLVRELQKGGFSPDYRIADSEEMLRDMLKSELPELILSDYSMPGFSGLEALRTARETDKNIPFIVISGAIGEETAVEAMLAGANDYLMKDNLRRLIPAVRRELQEAEIRMERDRIDKSLMELNEDLEKRVLERTNLLRSTNDRLQEEIEERKKAEKELADTKNFLNMILENIPDMIFVKEVSGFTYTFTNKSAEEFIGLSRDGIIGKSASELFAKDAAERISEQDQEILRIGGQIEFREELSQRTGERLRKFFTKKFPIFDDNGKAGYIVSISDDITERIKSEDELHKTEMRFTGLFRSSPMAVSLTRATDNVILDINPSYEELFGYTREEIIGKTAEHLDLWIHPEIRARILHEIFENGRVKDIEAKFRCKDGSIKIVDVFAEYIRAENDDPLIMFMAHDISEKKAAEEEIRVSLEKERDLNILKSRFISMISHEFRTPLTTIMLSTDLLKRYSEQWEKEEKIKHFDRIQETVLKMTQLMENVLTIGRMESGRFDFHPESIDLPAFCQSLADNIEFNSGGQQKINFSYNGGCENAYVDENILGLIITNLLSNAVKYSDVGVDVDFELFCEKEEAVLVIRDYGIGIPKSEQNHLFNTFFRASNVGTKSGYGMGLSIVQRCIEAHKGIIELESEENKGTTFTVKVPILPE